MIYRELITERLKLRALSKEDAKDIQFLRSDATVNQFVERAQTKTIEDALKFIKRIQYSVLNQKVCYWCITLKEKPNVIGTICLWNFSEDKKTTEIGYDLNQNFHGKGIMSEALKAVLEFGFQTIQVNTIEAFTHRENSPSVQLLKKQNFKLIENRVDEENSNNAIFVLDKQNFRIK